MYINNITKLCMRLHQSEHTKDDEKEQTNKQNLVTFQN